jgi:hypothetical protein
MARFAKTTRSRIVAAATLSLLLAVTSGCGMKRFGREIDTSRYSTPELEDAIARTAERWRSRDVSRVRVLCKNFGTRPQLVDALAKREDSPYDKDELKAIRNCGVETGSDEMVLWLSWGSPSERNRLDAPADVRREQWVYYGPYRASSRQYFYLTDGKVDDWESGR